MLERGHFLSQVDFRELIEFPPQAKAKSKRRRSSAVLRSPPGVAAAAATADESPASAAVKREPRPPADPLVFLGSEDVALDDKFELKKPDAPIEHLRSATAVQRSSIIPPTLSA